MTPTQTVLAFAAGLAMITLAGPVLAEDPNWNGDPEPPTEEPEPEPEPEAPTTTPDRPTESWADRNGKPQSRPLPCCIREGKLVAKPSLFMSAKRALMICEGEKTTGQALIYECPGTVSPEAVK